MLQWGKLDMNNLKQYDEYIKQGKEEGKISCN